MDHIGIDLHKRENQICLLAEGGELMERRIRTDPRRFARVLGERAPARILLEASTESEWVARCLEGLGHDVVVADPNFAPMYATRTRKVKTDRRDAPPSPTEADSPATDRASGRERTKRGRPKSASPASPPTQRVLITAEPVVLSESLTPKIMRKRGRPSRTLAEVRRRHFEDYPPGTLWHRLLRGSWRDGV